MNPFLPSSIVKGMKTLNRDLFNKVIQLPAVKVKATQCTVFRKHLKDKLLHHPKVKNIQKCDNDVDSKLLLLQPVDLNEEELEWIAHNNGTVTSKNVELTYRHYSIREVMQAVLPIETVKDIPSSFEEVGHILHLNLREEQLPYKEIIGEILIDKQPGIETVVNKVGSIDETFRFFKMDVLAGKDDMITTVKEHGYTFTFDFSKVYWNSRLHTEHQRIVDILKPKDVVLDVFAGVGPFAIPACHKGCIVYANDLNPYSYSSLLDNAKKNKVENLHGYCLDGRDFIRTVVGKLIAEHDVIHSTKPIVSHVIMNLPAIAVEFLDAFKGLFSSASLNIRPNMILPKVHCYCFCKGSEDAVEESVQQVQQNLGTELDPGSFSVFKVRDVAPQKLMMRVSFDLPPSIAYWTGEKIACEKSDASATNMKGIKRSMSKEDQIGSDPDIEGLGCSPPSAKKEKV